MRLRDPVGVVEEGIGGFENGVPAGLYPWWEGGGVGASGGGRLEGSYSLSWESEGLDVVPMCWPFCDCRNRRWRDWSLKLAFAADFASGVVGDLSSALCWVEDCCALWAAAWARSSVRGRDLSSFPGCFGFDLLSFPGFFGFEDFFSVVLDRCFFRSSRCFFFCFANTSS